MLERVSSTGVNRIKSEDGKMYIHTVFHDDAALARIQDLKNSGMLTKQKLGIHEDEDVRMVISCPDTLQWHFFAKKYPDIYKSLRSRDEKERMSAAKQLQILHPEWVAMSRL